MNYYGDEQKVVEELSTIPLREIQFMNFSLGLARFFLSLYCRPLFKNWTNNSGKDKMPPDYYSDKYHSLLEVMRVYDFEDGTDSPNAIESKIYKELDKSYRKRGTSLKEEKIAVHINAFPYTKQESGFVSIMTISAE